jgi:hypothetical protein
MAGMGSDNENNYLPVDKQATGCLATSSRFTDCRFIGLNQRFSNFFQVGTTFSVFFGLMFNLRGPKGQNPRTICGPRTTV